MCSGLARIMQKEILKHKLNYKLFTILIRHVVLTYMILLVKCHISFAVDTKINEI